MYAGKVLGIKVTGDSKGTNIKATQTVTSAVNEKQAAEAIEKMGFIPPEKQTSTKAETSNTFKLNKEDAIASLDALKTQMQNLMKAAGLLQVPSLDELVGLDKDGRVTVTEVFFSQKVKDDYKEMMEKYPEDADEWAEMYPFDKMNGLKKEPLLAVVTIKKTGVNTGILSLQSDPYLNAEMPFTYENGVLVIDCIQKSSKAYNDADLPIKGTLKAVYGKKDVTISGALHLTELQNSVSREKDFYMDYTLTCTIPMPPKP
jgi:hypothetical protein